MHFQSCFKSPFLFLAVCDFSVTKERASAITYSDPISDYYHAIFIKNPAETFNYTAYIEPLSYLSWIFIFFGCILAPFILYLTLRYF
jgi:hypothetical protein